MSDFDDALSLAELAEADLAGPEWAAWATANPADAAELELARRVRGLLVELRAAELELPPGFEARLMERVRADTTVLDLLDLGLGGVGRAVLELLALLFGLLPQPAPPTPATSG